MSTGWRIGTVLVLLAHLGLSVIVSWFYGTNGPENIIAAPIVITLAFLLALIYYVAKWFVKAGWAKRHSANVGFACFIVLLAAAGATAPTAYSHFPNSLDSRFEEWWMVSLAGNFVLIVFAIVDVIYWMRYSHEDVNAPQYTNMVASDGNENTNAVMQYLDKVM